MTPRNQPEDQPTVAEEVVGTPEPQLAAEPTPEAPATTVEDVTAAEAAVDSYNANHAAEGGEGE